MKYVHFCPKCRTTYGLPQNIATVCSDCYVDTFFSGYTDEEWYKKPYGERLQLAKELCDNFREEQLPVTGCLDLKQRRTIREKALMAYSDPIRLVDEEATSENNVFQAIKNCAETFGAEVLVYQEAIERGVFDNDPIPCLRICHPEHINDYYNFCIMRKTQGKTCVFQIFTYGQSRQMNLQSFQNNTRVFNGRGAGGVGVGLLRGGAIGAGFAIGSAAAGIVSGGGKLLAKGVAAIMRDDAALSKEKDWYELMDAVFQQVFLG